MLAARFTDFQSRLRGGLWNSSLLEKNASTNLAVDSATWPLPQSVSEGVAAVSYLRTQRYWALLVAALDLDQEPR
jgi:hypothetical protein